MKVTIKSVCPHHHVVGSIQCSCYMHAVAVQWPLLLNGEVQWTNKNGGYGGLVPPKKSLVLNHLFTVLDDFATLLDFLCFYIFLFCFCSSSKFRRGCPPTTDLILYFNFFWEGGERTHTRLVQVRMTALRAPHSQKCVHDAQTDEAVFHTLYIGAKVKFFSVKLCDFLCT